MLFKIFLSRLALNMIETKLAKIYEVTLDGTKLLKIQTRVPEQKSIKDKKINAFSVILLFCFLPPNGRQIKVSIQLKIKLIQTLS